MEKKNIKPISQCIFHNTIKSILIRMPCIIITFIPTSFFFSEIHQSCCGCSFMIYYQAFNEWHGMLTWALLRWDRCSSTDFRRLDGTFSTLSWLSIINVTSLVANSSSKSTSSADPRMHREKVWTICTGAKAPTRDRQCESCSSNLLNAELNYKLTTTVIDYQWFANN